jgi:hypothetical protein
MSAMYGVTGPDPSVVIEQARKLGIHIGVS